MRKSAMVSESEDGVAEDARSDVEVRRFRGQSHGRSGQSRFAVETGAAERSAEKKMGDGFHGLTRV